jgi:orotate phosphoribosyltransferase
VETEELAKKVLEVSYLEGDFTLRSGRKSHYLIDKYEFETRPHLLREVARELRDMLPPDAARLAGVELGGIPLATAVSLESGLPFVIVRKEKKGHGHDTLMEGELEGGEHVALLEDVTTTGGTACSAAKRLLEAGAGQVTVLVVVDRQEGAEETFGKAGISYEALFTRESLGIEADNE